MKAKKTAPKSIRFNIRDLELAFDKSKAETIQELVDLILNEYVKGQPVKKEPTVQPPVTNKIEDLKKIINKPFNKGYFEDSDNLEGISNPNAHF